MFGIGAEEFIAILVIALIVLGPDRLPVLMRTVGRWVRRLRDMSREFRQEFAEEFRFLQEELDTLRQEANETRAELAEIRRELGDTLQETADDFREARDDIMGEVESAVSADGPGSPKLPPGGDGPGTPADATVPGATARSGAAAGDPVGPADVMAEAIVETFSPNGAEESRPPEAAVIEPATTTLAPEQAAADGSNATAPLPEAVSAPAPTGGALRTPADAVVSSGFGSTSEPALQNQLGGFMRLIIMKALEEEPGFRKQAEETLKAQARLDAQRIVEIEDADVLEIAEAWARQRRQLVSRGSVTVEQKAPQSAVIGLSECPYGLEQGDAHPVCEVSNVYDVEFFKQFGAEGVYSLRMSDGAPRCQLLVVAKERLSQFGVEVTDGEEEAEAEAATGAAEQPVSDPVG